MNIFDWLLNRITMYRLVLYELLVLLFAAGILGSFGVISYSPAYLFLSVVFIFCVCWATNKLFAVCFKAPYNPESTWITALILALIISPPTSLLDPQYLPLAFWASAIAIASKYILAIRKKHIFNPAALGVFVTATTMGFSASWWVGTPWMLPFVLVGGLLIVRKIHRFDLWWSFLAMFSIGTTYLAVHNGADVLHALSSSFLYTSAMFVATVMLIEPMTTPPSRSQRILYGIVVGILFLPNINIGSFYLTPEIAILVGNIFAYLVSPKEKLLLKLKEKIALSHNVSEFIFTPERRLAFSAGQYMEWTLPHHKADARGVRRFFTVSSAPSESDIHISVKSDPAGSTFKKSLFALQPGDTIVASQLAGDFTLPRDKNQKLVFIAGGIGITPFCSMIHYLLDSGEKRPITILYANKTPEDVVYRDLLDRAERELGIKTIYTYDEAGTAPSARVCAIDEALIGREIPDCHERTFYISGPQGMVTSLRKMLIRIGVKRANIKTDYFPGFA